MKDFEIKTWRDRQAADDPIGTVMKEFADRIESVEKKVSASDGKTSTIIRLRPAGQGQ